MRKLFNYFNVVALIKNGFVGFLTFLLIIIVSKFIGNYFGIQNEFTLDFHDLTISILGFLLFVLIKIIDKFSSTRKT